MKNKLFYLPLILLLSCKKDNEAASDSEMPVITITTPVNAQTFSPGQTITVTAAITDNEKIREIHLEIINTTTGAFVMHEHYTPGTASYQVNRTFTAQAASAYKIKVEAEDMAKNGAKTEVTINVN